MTEPLIKREALNPKLSEGAWRPSEGAEHRPGDAAGPSPTKAAARRPEEAARPSPALPHAGGYPI